jgi:multisubunit Na+/H+ antiporter MnhG subunit
MEVIFHSFHRRRCFAPAIEAQSNEPMNQGFQFSLKRIFVAMALVAIGLGLLRLPNPYPRLLSVWFAVSCALFGAAIGVVCGRIEQLAAYGFVGAVAFIIYAWIT